MDADLLAFERIANAARRRWAWRRHWLRFAAAMSVMAFVLGYSAIGTWRSAGRIVWPLLIWAAAACALTAGAFLLLSQRHGQRYSRLVTPGPWSSGQIHSTATVAEIAGWLGGKLAARELILVRLDRTRVTATSRGIRSQRINYQIDVRPSTERPGHRVITIASWPAARAARHDFCGAERPGSALVRTGPGGGVLPAGTPPARPPAGDLGPA